MKYLLTLIICLSALGAQAQYSFHADTLTCRMEVQYDSTTISYNFLIDEVRYADRNSGTVIYVFDEDTGFAVSAGAIDNFASIVALKTQIDAWIKACR